MKRTEVIKSEVSGEMVPKLALEIDPEAEAILAEGNARIEGTKFIAFNKSRKSVREYNLADNLESWPGFSEAKFTARPLDSQGRFEGMVVYTNPKTAETKTFTFAWHKPYEPEL